MKTFLLLPILLSAFSATAFTGLPNSLECMQIKCTDIEPPGAGSWCPQLPSTTISNLKSNPAWEGSHGQLIRDEDFLNVDFSESDQTTIFKFKYTDLIKLNNNEMNQIPGVFTYGFDWADGDHTRFVVEFSCRKLN